MAAAAVAPSSTRPPRRSMSTSKTKLSKAREGAVRYHHDPEPEAEPTKSATSVSVSVSTVPRHEKEKKHSRRGSFLGSLFRPPLPPPAPRSTSHPNLKKVDCLTCGSDDVPIGRTAKLGCGHRMCNSCLRRIFTMSVSDPQHMPPRCCGADHIPLNHVDHLFDTKFKMLWNKKYQEYTTKNRLYCPAKGCGQWIRPQDMHKHQGRRYGRCPRCKTNVCPQCNNKLHSSGECPRDEDTRKLVEIGKEKGWQRCFNCRAMVELNEGCNHMTCRCTAQFCMLCASPWKSCDCPWFNHTNLSDQDRLNHMRVPEDIRRHRRQSPTHPPSPRPHRNDHHDRHERERNPALTYQQELDARRRQERADEALARRLQASTLHTPAHPRPPRPSSSLNQSLQRPSSLNQPPQRPPSQRRPSSLSHQQQQQQPHQRPRRNTVTEEQLFGNQATHFLNEDFIQEATNLVVNAIGDPSFARRGERQSGRRPRRESLLSSTDPGLAPGAFGTESLLGFAAAPPPPAAMTNEKKGVARRSSLRERLGSMSRENGRDRIGGWLNRL